MAISKISDKTNARIVQLDGTAENVAAGTGTRLRITAPDVSDYSIAEVINIYQPDGKNLTPIWLAYYDRNNRTIDVMVYNARTGAADITVAVHLLLIP